MYHTIMVPLGLNLARQQEKMEKMVTMVQMVQMERTVKMVVMAPMALTEAMEIQFSRVSTPQIPIIFSLRSLMVPL